MAKKKPALPKRKSKFHSVAFTLKVCEDMGWLAGKTEYRLPYGRGGFGMTKDLFGFIDVLAVVPGHPGVVGLQVTSDACLQRRIKKITTECDSAARKFLEAQNYIEVWGYKRVMVGKRVSWDARRFTVIRDDNGAFEALQLPDLSVIRKVYKNANSH